jgi:filamentous hemagglutinin family protein
MKHVVSFFDQRPTLPLPLVVLVVGSYLMFASLKDACTAHAETPITPSGLHTQVSAPDPPAGGKTQYDITGGTRPGGGLNLFHSFGDFGVPRNNIANFQNGISFDLNGSPFTAGLPTANILARVTNQNPSVIFGTIQTTGFGNASLFLMNPSGIVFGPTASLNVGGSVTFTTANYLRLADNVLFNATPNAVTDALLNSSPIAAFGFLNPSSAIAVQGSKLSVPNGQALSFISGNQGFSYTNPDTGHETSVPGGITVSEGHLSAAGGQINLDSVTSPGEISAVNLTQAPGAIMGEISLSQGTVLDTSANAAGTVRIRGGQLTIDNATISSNTNNADGSPIAIDIHVDGDMFLANDRSPALSAKTTGTGHAGSINLHSGNLEGITSSLDDGLVALVDTHTSGTGTAGNVTITTRNLHATNQAFFIDTGTAGTGHGGDVTIHGTHIMLEGPNIATGNFRFGQLLEQDVRGSAGNLTITASDRLQIGPATALSTEARFANGGNISLEGRDVSIIGNSFVGINGDFGGATITVKADRLMLNSASVLSSNTVVDRGGTITINSRTVELTEGSLIQTSTIGDGVAGDIKITASDQLTLDGRNVDEPGFPTGIVSNFYAISGFLPKGIGGSGAITVTTPKLQIQGGALINTSTNNSGNAGNISIFSDAVTISGQSPVEVTNTAVEIGSTRGSGIYTRTVGSNLCLRPCGNAGNINIKADSLTLDNGGTINSGTTNIGFGGNITLTARQSATIQDGATISAKSTGPGNAGNILINAGQQFEMQNGSITTQAAQASGGNIDIRAIDRVRLVNSPISSSVQGGPTTAGGNITIDPKVVVLQNSDILARARQGNGGNITITTPLFLADQTSLVDASSQFGLSGIVRIQSPTSNLSGTVTQLSSKTAQTQALLQNRCVALAGGEQSTFILASRDALPSEPGGWLSSPVSMERWMGENTEHATGVIAGTRKLNDSRATIARVAQGEVLSLRRLTPPGFLVRTFATGTTGCSS